MRQERMNKTKPEDAGQHHVRIGSGPVPDFEKENDIGDTPFEPLQEDHAAMLDRADTGEKAVSLLLHLQRTYGNAYVQRLLESSSIQAKLKVSSPQDQDELQAERVAQQVVDTVMPAPDESRGAGEQAVNADRLESRLSAGGGGRALSQDVRSYMEPRFGADFGGVRVHTDSEAASMSQALSAQAFTYGRDIYFGQGRYNPASQAGKKLLAHELTHVVQQTGAVREMDRLPVFRWSQARPGGQSGAVSEDDDGVDTSDWTAPIDTDSDTMPVGETASRQIGWSQSSGNEVIHRNGVTFPTYDEISSNGTVKTEVDSAWKETLDATTKTTRREQGFWIRWNSKTSAYSVTGKVVGETVNNDETAGISKPGAKPADAGDEYTVGFFHTHTPTRYRPYGRPVGPSNADLGFHTHPSINVAGVVYDYEAAKGNEIPAGHPLNSKAILWHSGPERRT